MKDAHFYRFSECDFMFGPSWQDGFLSYNLMKRDGDRLLLGARKIDGSIEWRSAGALQNCLVPHPRPRRLAEELVNDGVAAADKDVSVADSNPMSSKDA